jgi:hypothetical protein
MINLSITKVYAFFCAILLLLPMTSFNTESKIVESKVARHIAIEKAKIDIKLKQANYSEGLNQTY